MWTRVVRICLITVAIHQWATARCATQTLDLLAANIFGIAHGLGTLRVIGPNVGHHVANTCSIDQQFARYWMNSAIAEWMSEILWILVVVRVVARNVSQYRSAREVPVRGDHSVTRTRLRLMFITEMDLAYPQHGVLPIRSALGETSIATNIAVIMPRTTLMVVQVIAQTLPLLSSITKGGLCS
jgi:hypothetical protein